MSDFTPGPWKADADEDITRVVLPGGVIWFARGYGGQIGAAQADEDARLIAAAPDLLSALKLAHAALLEALDDYNDSDLGTTVARALEKARSSVATE